MNSFPTYLFTTSGTSDVWIGQVLGAETAITNSYYVLFTTTFYAIYAQDKSTKCLGLTIWFVACASHAVPIRQAIQEI